MGSRTGGGRGEKRAGKAPRRSCERTGCSGSSARAPAEGPRAAPTHEAGEGRRAEAGGDPERENEQEIRPRGSRDTDPDVKQQNEQAEHDRRASAGQRDAATALIGRESHQSGGTRPAQ